MPGSFSSPRPQLKCHLPSQTSLPPWKFPLRISLLGRPRRLGSHSSDHSFVCLLIITYKFTWLLITSLFIFWAPWLKCEVFEGRIVAFVHFHVLDIWTMPNTIQWTSHILLLNVEWEGSMLLPEKSVQSSLHSPTHSEDSVSTWSMHSSLPAQSFPIFPASAQMQ